MPKLAFVGALIAVAVAGCAVSAEEPASGSDVQVMKSGEALTITAGHVTVSTTSGTTNGLEDGASLTIVFPGGTYKMTRNADQGLTTSTGANGSSGLVFTSQDRADLRIAAQMAADQGSPRVASVLRFFAAQFDEGVHQTADLTHAKMLNAEGSRCGEARTDGWVYTRYWSSGWPWNKHYSSAWTEVGPNGSACFGLCGPSCDGLGRAVYSDACAVHDRCVRDKTGGDGWSALINPFCDLLFPAAAWSLLHELSCF